MVAVQALPETYSHLIDKRYHGFRIGVSRNGSPWTWTGWKMGYGSMTVSSGHLAQDRGQYSYYVQYAVWTDKGFQYFDEYAHHTQLYYGGFRRNTGRSCLV